MPIVLIGAAAFALAVVWVAVDYYVVPGGKERYDAAVSGLQSSWGAVQDQVLQPVTLANAGINVYLASQAAKRTWGGLGQVADHLSRMQGGAAVGGFPGFEPPKGDDNYRNKVEKSTYSGQDVNDWVQDINKHLENIVKDNPGRSMEQILQSQYQAQGMSEAQVADATSNFLTGIRTAQSVASGFEGYGVTSETLDSLNTLMQTLGVAPW